MKELDFLKIIKNTLSNNNFLGDDCATLKDLGISVTQDALIENVHFSLKTISPYELGYKSIAVNLSDLSAALTKPVYVFISLSLPKNINSVFVKSFYEGVNDICTKYDVVVAGGDITSADIVAISVCAIGKNFASYYSSRSFAKVNDLVVITGEHGASACGLFLLQNNINDIAYSNIIKQHLSPEPCVEQALLLANNITDNIAVMDTSDGLADALFKISQNSNVTLSIDFEKLIIDKKVQEIAQNYSVPLEQFVFWGGEDYKLVICISSNDYKKLPAHLFKVIGTVKPMDKDKNVIVNVQDTSVVKSFYINETFFEDKIFKHF